MSEFPQDVVGHVDDVADRPEPDRPQPGGEPRRRPRHGDPRDHARRVAGAELHVLDAHAGQGPGLVAALRHRDGRILELPAAERGELPRHAHHRQAVWAVGRDLDLEHPVVEPEVRDKIAAERRVLAHDEDAGRVLLAEPELPLGAEHSLRVDAVDLRDRDRARAGQAGARRREGRAHPRDAVRRAAHDLEALAARADTDEQTGVPRGPAKIAFDRLDLADDDVGQVGCQARDAPHLHPAIGEPIGRGLRREVGPEKLRDPAPGELHAERSPAIPVPLGRGVAPDPPPRAPRLTGRLIRTG